MKGIRSNIPRALNAGAQIACVDNTGGAKVVEIISVKKYRGVKNRMPCAGIGGDMCVVSVKKAHLK